MPAVVRKSRKQTRREVPRQRRRDRPIELYYWPTPNGWKISIMLEECGLPYVVRPVDISKGKQFTPEFLAISPNNRMPAIIDPDGPGGSPISVFESGAILQYLGRKTGNYYPKRERGRVAVEEWLFWQMGGLGPMAGAGSSLPPLRPAPDRLRDRALYGRGQSAIRRDELAASTSRGPVVALPDPRDG